MFTPTISQPPLFSVRYVLLSLFHVKQKNNKKRSKLLNQCSHCLASLLLSTLLSFSVSFKASAQTDNTATLLPIINYILLEEESPDSDPPLVAASRFLMQTTFGPKYDDIVALSNSTFEQWLDTQFALPPTHMVDYIHEQNWFSDSGYPLIIASTDGSTLLNVMISAPDQLRQRVAYALSQIFVVSLDVSNGINERPLFYLDYYDMLMDHAFGNYRDLLEAVTLNDVMGFYLSMKLNAPAGTQVGPVNHPASFFVSSPDENYAREVMQLFSIGLVELNLDGTPVIENGSTVPSYTQETVENFARVFTGWNFKSATGTNFFNLGTPPDTRPMIAFDDFHDMQPKVLLNNQRLNGGQTAVQDLDDALDNIFNHQNVAPFISKLLIQHLVTSNPTPAYVERIANVFNGNNPNGSSAEHARGDLKEVIRHILLDDEARNGHRTLPTQFGKYKEPYIRLLSLWRGLEARRRTNVNDFTSYDRGFWQRFRQFPLRAPSVFNFYQPDFSPPGVLTEKQLLAPVSQLMDTESIIGIATTFEEYVQRHHDDAGNSFASSPTNLLLNTAPLQALVPDELINPTDLIERLNLIFMAGAMSDEMKQILLEVHDPEFYIASNKWQIVIDLVNIIMLSPQYSIQK